MSEYYGYNGRPFTRLDANNGGDYILRISRAGNFICEMWAVDPRTLAPLENLTEGWRGRTMPSVWQRILVDEDIEVDVGL